MNDQERYKITSNEYADLIYMSNRISDSFANIAYSVNEINNKFSTVFIPVSNMTYNSVYKYSYIAIPKCFGLLSATGMEEGGISHLRTMQTNDLKGSGILIGIIDTGIEYTNPLFFKTDHTTRIVSIWDQNIESNDRYPADIYYGREYTKEEINQALMEEDPLSVVPSTDEIGHGTMMAGIAGGYNPANTNFIGAAPDADFAIVKLKQAKPYLKEFFFIPESAICFQENDIMMGVTYLQKLAETLNRPLVICLGVGTSQGAHMGQCYLCEYLNNVNAIRGRSIVVAAGNEGNRGHHFYGEIMNVDETINVELNVGKNEQGFSMEFWGDAPSVFSVDIFTPDGRYIAHITPTILQENTMQLIIDDTILYIDNQVRESRVGDQFILFRFHNPMIGVWRFQIYAVEVFPRNFHVWLPIDNFISKETYFNNSNDYTTILMIGNTDKITTITAYNPINATLYYNASKGFTKNGNIKPEVAAPGVNIYAPTMGGSFTNTTGTGVAAAHGAGIVALLLEWGIMKGNLPQMNGVDVNRILIQGASRNPDIMYPNPEWGYGILDLNNSLEMIVDLRPLMIRRNRK
ncbi:MAG: hypothetical protein K0S61_3986 [Anaerocolumna sp.]|jgi:subtilisin family serine protease|nr:hypothetical protein [Anaerocolumna sp.]